VIPAVVPVKALADSKSRLFPDRARADVEALSLAMMGDVIECLRATRGVGRVVIVTPDRAIAEAALAEGGEALLRDDPGLNPAIEAASAEVAGAGDAVLVMLGDVAAADPGEVARLVAESPARGIALAPSSDGGTSALVRRPASVIAAHFGRDSAKRHREAAATAGVACVERALPSLAIDVDFGEDARAILGRDTLGRRTRALLETWGTL
jgi:2-phospho-L-lactate guanylyltransferase